MGLSKEERDKRFTRGQQSAREILAAKEIFSLRLQPKSILRIYDIAKNRGLHASDLVRGWIEKCIYSEDHVSSEAPSTENAALVLELRNAVRMELEHFISSTQVKNAQIDNIPDASKPQAPGV